MLMLCQNSAELVLGYSASPTVDINYSALFCKYCSTPSISVRVYFNSDYTYNSSREHYCLYSCYGRYYA